MVIVNVICVKFLLVCVWLMHKEVFQNELLEVHEFYSKKNKLLIFEELHPEVFLQCCVVLSI